MEVGRTKAKGHGACDLVFGKKVCSKNLRDTVPRCLRFGLWEEVVSKILGTRCLRLSVWAGFSIKKLRGTALAIWDLRRVSFQSKLRDTVLAIMEV